MKKNSATNILFASLMLPLVVDVTVAFPIYTDRIPNGRSVPNPGPQGGVWAGVGHVNAAGGGARNPFGLDFKDANFTWTPELCKMDSDGDGRSNGEELGDPDCIWEMGDEPTIQPAPSHPGIVDEAPPASNDTTTLPGLSANYCDDYEDPDDVQILDIAFTVPNTLNSTRTHYRCEQVTIDPPKGITDQYQVRSDVLISNPNVLHHIWIYHCTDGTGQTSSDGARVDEGPYECNGVESNCQIVAGWAVGPEENCEPPNVAVQIDFASSNVFKIEAHYDNSMMVNNVTDQSGMSLRLTPTPRYLLAGLVIVGMDYHDRQFTVPAQQEVHEIANICPSDATLRGLQQPVYVYSWNPHMHLYGKKLVTEHYRCGVKIGEIGRIDEYEFDNQQSYVLNPPVKVLPGDSLVTTCTYNTTGIDKDVAGGEETTEEMCDNYMGYYPYAGTVEEPTLFTACTAFQAGVNPKYTLPEYDDTTPYVTLDLSGEIFIDEWTTGHSWSADPTDSKNIAPCCATNTCESDYLADRWSPCGVTADCKDGLVCDGGICVNRDGGGQWWGQSNSNNNKPAVETNRNAPPANSKDEEEEEDGTNKAVENTEASTATSSGAAVPASSVGVVPVYFSFALVLTASVAATVAGF